MRKRFFQWEFVLAQTCLIAWLGVGPLRLALPAEADALLISVDPEAVSLVGPVARYSLLVSGIAAEVTDENAGSGLRASDLTTEATFRSETPEVVTVDEGGVVRPVSDGHGAVVVEVRGQSVTVLVHVRDSQTTRHVSFVNDIMPLLDKYGCNGAGCHGKAEGQAGFKLSVFNSDPRADYEAIVEASRGRRVSAAFPEASLILQKASGGVPHGGGVRVDPGTEEYDTLRDWMAAGVPYAPEIPNSVVRVEVTPRERVAAVGRPQQLRVMAYYSGGGVKDVTHLAQYESNSAGVATVTEGGLVTTQEQPGQAAIRASFMNRFDVFRVLVPRSPAIEDYPELTQNNFIDGLVYRKLRQLNIVPSDLADDAEYLRRVYVDVIGTLPTADEVRRFLRDDSADKRARVVDELLRRPEYAEFWALKWSDVLRVERLKLGHGGAYEYYKWIRNTFAANKPFDQFVRELLTARGALVDAPQGYFYKAVGDPGERASDLSHALLGVSIECAQCHHHPTDVWSQTDYYGMQAFFTEVKFKGTPRGDALHIDGAPPTKHPRTGEVVVAHALGTEMPEALPIESGGDRRQVLADWLLAKDNPRFSRNIANRIWAHFLGRGIIAPADDIRESNPPSNPELLEALASHLVEKDYDLHSMIRTITASRTYQLSSEPNKTNSNDVQNYSRAYLRPLEAEVLLDAVSQVTGVPEKFEGFPTGMRAIQLWDSGVQHYFLKLFGRPVRQSVCICERNTDANVAQALHLMNSPNIHSKLIHAAGTVSRLLEETNDEATLVDRLYLTFLSRFPTPKERTRALGYLERAVGRRRGVEDLAWSLLCTIEFSFRH